MQTMNPEIFPMGMKPHHSNNYKSIVTIFDINNVSKKSSPMRMKRQTILGRPDEQETNQKMSMGLVDRQHQVPFEPQDILEEEAEGIKPVQEESPEKISKQQDNNDGNNPFLTPPQSRRGSTFYNDNPHVLAQDFNEFVSQHGNHPESMISHTNEYKPIEMKDYEMEYMEKDQYQLLPELSEHASDHRKVEHEMPRLMASDIYTTGALGTQFTSETMAVDEGGDELTPFKPQQIIMDAPKPSSKRSSIARMDESTPRTSVQEIKPLIRKPYKPGPVKPKAGIKRKQPPDTKPNTKKPRRPSAAKPVAGLKRQAEEEASISQKSKKRRIKREAKSHADFSKDKAKKIAKSMVSLAVKNKVHKNAAENVAKTQSPSRRNSATAKALEEARVDAVYKHNKEKRAKAKRKADKAEKKGSPSSSRRGSKSSPSGSRRNSKSK
jgi:hypothetical protein